MRRRPVRRWGGDYETGPETPQESAARAVDDWLESASWGQLPTSDYRVERDDGGRVLFSYDVGEHTKIAFIVADGIADLDGDEGWGVESWA